MHGSTGRTKSPSSSIGIFLPQTSLIQIHPCLIFTINWGSCVFEYHRRVIYQQKILAGLKIPWDPKWSRYLLNYSPLGWTAIIAATVAVYCFKTLFSGICAYPWLFFNAFFPLFSAMPQTLADVSIAGAPSYLQITCSGRTMGFHVLFCAEVKWQLLLVGIGRHQHRGASPSTQAGWSCPFSLQFCILRPRCCKISSTRFSFLFPFKSCK